jgi:hypothetical protein
MPQAVAAAGEQQVTVAGCTTGGGGGRAAGSRGGGCCTGRLGETKGAGGGGLQNAQVWSLARGLNHKSGTDRRIFI